MKLVQLNTWHLRLTKKIVDIVEKEEPDIITLQEVPDSVGNPGIVETLTDLRKQIDYPYVYQSPAHSFKVMKQDVNWGNVILSKLPIDESGTTFTNEAYTDDFSFESHTHNIRNFQHVTMTIHDKKLHVLNHHGYHIAAHKNGDEQTLKACHHIAEYISGLEGAVILTGDFNLIAESESMQVFNGLLRNLTKEYGLTTTRTDLTKKQEACDHVLVNDLVKVNDYSASDIVASDHQALVLDFSL